MESSRLDCRGLACPQPVVETKKMLDTMTAGTLDVLVDNETAKNNVLKLVASLGLSAATREAGGIYTVTIIKEEQAAAPERDGKRKSLLLAQETFGLGDEELGRILMKSFLYALAESDNLPEALYLVNGGVKLACSGSPVLDALQRLEALGVQIYSCGLCLDYFKLKDSLEAGGITNMYAIVEQITAGTVIRL
ncbi:MAG TPA: sulfurtransferase-like selenium metabolism protein YedF [Firmicutes bacterium]|nr:sulfurtransferase-like selenium metabolism protein YedF [Bacillota bacterium]